MNKITDEMVEALDLVRVLSLADARATESREDGSRLLDQAGLYAFAQDIALDTRAALEAAMGVGAAGLSWADYWAGQGRIDVSHNHEEFSRAEAWALQRFANSEAGNPVSAQATPSSRWAEAGNPDPHGKQYACERAALAMGHLTDDELANEVFIKGDRKLSYTEMVAGELPASAYLLAAKDRIRWLSRALAAREPVGLVARNPLLAYVDNYRMMSEMGDGRVSAYAVALDIEKNMVPHVTPPTQPHEPKAVDLGQFRDAQRYRWLRDFALHHEEADKGTPYIVYGLGMGDAEPCLPSEIDAMVDHSMSQDVRWKAENDSQGVGK